MRAEFQRSVSNDSNFFFFSFLEFFFQTSLLDPVISTGIKFLILALISSERKEKKRIDKIFLNARKFLVSRPGPLFLSRPGLLPFARLRFPFRFEQLTRVEDALFQKKVQTLAKNATILG